MLLSQQASNFSASARSKHRSFFESAKGWDEQMGSSGNRLQRKTLSPAILRLMGSPKGKIIYDMACGNGHLARCLVRAGAKQIWASDISEPMITMAKKYKSHNIRYFVTNAMNFQSIPRCGFDIVLLNRAIGYMARVDLLLKGIRQALKPGGSFIFTLSHPLKPVALKALGKKVDIFESSERYLRRTIERAPQRPGRLFSNPIYRRPLSYYVNLCSANGLYVHRLLEPQTTVEFGKKNHTTHIPMYLVIEAKVLHQLT